MAGTEIDADHDAANSDPRFTYGLIFDVKAVLEARGYQIPQGAETAELMLALFRFLYPSQARS